jgi:hypothetical protein
MSQPAKEQQLPSLGGILGSNRRSVRATDPQGATKPQGHANLSISAPANPMGPATAAKLGETSTQRQIPHSAQAASDPGKSYLLPRSIYLPRTLHKNATVFAKQNDTTVTALVLEAVNEVHTELGSYFAARAAAPKRPGDLFAVPQRKNKAGERTFQTTIRVTDEQLSVLDELASTHAVDRSKLVSSALRLYIESLMPNADWNSL